MKFPLVTLIMPIRNESGFIEKSLGSVLAQDYPADRLEIIVVDGMSTDGTREIVQSFQREYPIITIIDNPGKIVPKGINAALKSAKGDVIVRVDGHCEIFPDYVRQCVRHLLDSKADGVGGPIETVGNSYTAQAIALAMSSKFGVGGSAFRTIKDREIFAETVPFPAYTRQAIEKAGNYDEELVRNQDDEYNYRLRKLGGRLLLSPDIRSRYYSRSTFRSLWRQYFQYGYWKVRVMQKHPHQMRLRQVIPFLFVFSLGVSLASATVTEMGFLAFKCILGSYAGTNLTASILEARNGRWRFLPALPVIFTILHFSYGTGFMKGLFKFRNRWRRVDEDITQARITAAPRGS